MAADFLSVSGLWFGIFANFQLMILLGLTDFYKALILVVGPVFLILTSPYAGKVIDRYPVKNIITIAGLVQFSCAILQLYAFYSNSVLILIFSLVMLNIANAFYTPSLKSAIAFIVPNQKLLEANALYMNVTTISRISITAISGLALSFLPLLHMYIAVIICYFIMNFLRLYIHINESIDKRSFQKSLPFKDVFLLLGKKPILIGLMMNVSMIYLFLGGSNLVILKLSELHENHVIQGFLYGIEGIFLMIAGFVVKKIYGKRNLLLINTVLVTGTGIAVYIMQFGVYSVWSAFLGYSLFGFFMGCWLPSYSTISQLIIPEEIRGRFFAFQEMWNRITQQLALLYTGFMLEFFNLFSHLHMTSIAIISISLVVLVWNFKRDFTISLHESTFNK
ncbi:MFS transporter [Chengkuizengella axinellae]|uniref:MFS transporter n=1 Tax=Chengkuizengella axinellae TaxID=3064388 RepID=UPI003528E737